MELVILDFLFSIDLMQARWGQLIGNVQVWIKSFKESFQGHGHQSCVLLRFVCKELNPGMQSEMRSINKNYKIYLREKTTKSKTKGKTKKKKNRGIKNTIISGERNAS